ncbi:hypothetical protein PYW08_002058 [Mythimna loreyi]|uniref:Uncharacterized protein n=1 Tax=Mythimna loreyi TaxID=667449 RepID=A0ACC2R3D4_9NEOP|nr:hypothetical protein PYW08_002058 [Mythimna loreyi]
MASRSQEQPVEEPAPTKYLAPTLASLTESLSLLGVSPETLAMSLGESLAERYLASLRSKPVERVERPMERIIERPLAPLGGCGIPRHTPLAEPSLQLFSNDFIDYLNQIA